MFNFFNKPTKTKGKLVSFQIDGLHCSSCGLNIDGELEETAGVISATTSYSQGKTDVEFDAEIINIKQIQSIIEQLDYGAKEVVK